MHELGIVFHIIDSVEEVAREHKLSRVTSVTLELGEVSGIVPTYLTDCWNWAVKKSDYLQEAKLLIEEIPALSLCESCQKTYPTVAHGKTCPHCGSEETHLFQGDESIIKEIATPDEA